MRFIGNIETAMDALKSSKTGAAPSGTPQRNVVTNAPLPNSSFAQSAASYTPMRRSAQVSGNVIYTQPSFFSPLHTPQNWQIPTKRREIYQWLYLLPCQVVTTEFVYRDVMDLWFETDSLLDDPITGGVMLENVECEKILSSRGTFRKPTHASVRKVVDKDAIEFKAWGYWRSLHVSEDHKQIWMDGKTYRKKAKLDANTEYRRRHGVPQGTRRHPAHLETKIIRKGSASEVSTEDYLLFPVSSVGETSIDLASAWMIGNCIADGSINCRADYSRVAFTMRKDEATKTFLEASLSTRFSGKVSSRPHGEGKGWRVNVWTRESAEFFSEYITGKLTQKRFTGKVFDLDRESRLNVLAGYLDGDGSFDKDTNWLVANNYSQDMADQLYALFLSVGIHCSLTRHPLYGDHYETDSKWCYRLIVPASDVPKISPYMRGDKVPKDFIAPKQRELRFFYEEDGVTYLAQPIEYIKKYKYTGLGIDFQIDPERAFVANGYVSSNCRYYYENEPKVASAIDFYSHFAINGFETQCEHHAIKRFFDQLNKKLNLDYWAKLISKEYYMLGDVFPFLEIECQKCHGGGFTDSGKVCRHPGGSFRRLVVLNPDWIDVQTNVMVDDPVITLLPDDELKKIVWRKQPKAIYDRLPVNVRALILGNRPIPLSNECVSHLRHNPYPYGTYGVSLIRRLFKTLAYKDKLMSAQWIIAERMILPVRVVKLGDPERPAGPADIADVQQQLANVVNDPNLTLVTHHAFNYEWIGTSGKVLQLSNEYELIDKEILQGLMINEALLSGMMGSYQSAAIGAEAMIQRMESWRLELARWIENHIYKPVAQMKGFVDEAATKEVGEPVWICPKISWNELNIRDDSQQKQLLNALFDKGLLSGQSLLEKYDLDYDHEIERLRFESATQKLAGMAGAGAAGAMIGGGMGGGGAAGGMEGLFGGGGGAAPGPEMGGAPEMGGGAEMGGAPAAPAAAAGAGIGGTMGKILAKGRRPMGTVPDEADIQPVTVRLTSLEAMMYKEIAAMRLPFTVGVQQQVGPYVADFCIPMLKMDIEVDGAYWHNQPETKAHDEVRDLEMSRAGWTVLRFGESELKERLPEVRKTILAYVHKNWRRAIDAQKRQAQALEARMKKIAGDDEFVEMPPVIEPEVDGGDSDQGTGNPVG